MARSRTKSPFFVDIDVAGAALAVADAFAEFGEKALPRAMQFSVNGVAIDAVRRFRQAEPAILDHPNGWTLDGIAYEADKKALSKITSLGQVKAVIYIKPEVSEYLKYQFGFEKSTRRGGEIGLEGYLPSDLQQHVLVPLWQNINLTQGVYEDRFGNVPTSFMRRVRRSVTKLSTGLSDSEEAKRKRESRSSSQWSMWAGPIKLKGTMVEAIIARPPRKADRTVAKRNFMSSSRGIVNVPRVRDEDVSRILFLMAPSATYEPILQKP